MSEDWTLNHLGMMVTNKKAVLNHFQSLGIGVSIGPQPLMPYEEGEGELTYFRTLDGNPITHRYTTGGVHDFKDGQSQIGDCQLEVYPMKPGPGMFISEYLLKKGSGINHIAFNTPNIDQDTQKLLDKGCNLVFNATINGKTIENYLDTRKFGDVMISLRPPASEWEKAWRENNISHPLVRDWKISGVGILVEDIELATEYYLDLGFSLEGTAKEYEALNVKSNQLKIGPLVFELLESTSKDLIYHDCFVNRGEGIADIMFLVEDINIEIENLVKKGVNLLVSTSEYAIFDTRKEGNIITRLFQS